MNNLKNNVTDTYIYFIDFQDNHLLLQLGSTGGQLAHQFWNLTYLSKPKCSICYTPSNDKDKEEEISRPVQVEQHLRD